MQLEDLQKLRRSIDAIDRQILDLVTERAKLALAVGELKRTHQLPIYDPDREREMLDELAAEAKAPLGADAVRRLFECVITESRLLQQRHHPAG